MAKSTARTVYFGLFREKSSVSSSLSSTLQELVKKENISYTFNLDIVWLGFVHVGGTRSRHRDGGLQMDEGWTEGDLNVFVGEPGRRVTLFG